MKFVFVSSMVASRSGTGVAEAEAATDSEMLSWVVTGIVMVRG